MANTQFRIMVQIKGYEPRNHNIRFDNLFCQLETMQEVYCKHDGINNRYVLADGVEEVTLIGVNQKTGEHKYLQNYLPLSYDYRHPTNNLSFISTPFHDDSIDVCKQHQVAIIVQLCSEFKQAFNEVIETVENSDELQELLGKAEVKLRENYVMLFYEAIDPYEKNLNLLELFLRNDLISKHTKIHVLNPWYRKDNSFGKLSITPFYIVPTMTFIWL